MLNKTIIIHLVTFILVFCLNSGVMAVDKGGYSNYANSPYDTNIYTEYSQRYVQPEYNNKYVQTYTGVKSENPEKRKELFEHIDDAYQNRAVYPVEVTTPKPKGWYTDKCSGKSLDPNEDGFCDLPRY